MVVIVEGEDLPLVGAWSTYEDPAASGGEYIVWEGLKDNKSNNQSPEDIITATIQITIPGTYSFKWKMRQPDEDEVPSDRANDTWLYFPDATRFGPANKDTDYAEFVKVYGNAQEGKFEYDSRAEEADHDKSEIAVEFAELGEYTMQIAGRSHGHEIDQIILFGDTLEVDFAAGGC